MEKPRAEGWASAGFFVFEKEIFDYLGAGEAPWKVWPETTLERAELTHANTYYR